MSRATVAATVVVVSLGAAAIWLAGRDRGPATKGETADAAPDMAYDMEAHDVVLRQMDADGRQEFQVEARQITQAPGNGEISATALTLYHDPPGTAAASPNRWTLTADGAQLPPEGGIVTFQGNVRAAGRPASGGMPVTLTTSRLRYDLDAQSLSSDADVAVTRGSMAFQARGMRFDIKTSELTLESKFNGTFTR